VIVAHTLASIARPPQIPVGKSLTSLLRAGLPTVNTARGCGATSSCETITVYLLKRCRGPNQAGAAALRNRGPVSALGTLQLAWWSSGA
jgi:hypothetical protein